MVRAKVTYGESYALGALPLVLRDIEPNSLVHSAKE